MAIDRIDAHFDAMIDKMNVDVSDNKYWKRAGVHIGYYIEWAFYVGFANPEIHGSIEEIQDIFDSNYNGLQFLIEHCDGKFCDDDLNAEGKKFTSYVYDKYIENFEKIVGHKLYTKDYNEQDLQAVSEYLDKVFEKYLEYLQIEEMNNKRMKNEILERCSFAIKALTAVDVFAIIMFLISFGIEIAAIIVFGILVIAITLGIVLCKKILKDPLKYKKYFLSEKSVGEAVSKDNQFNHKIEEIKIIPKEYNKTNIDVKADETNTELDMEKVEKIVNAVKKATARESYSIQLQKEKTLLFDSKFGGVPYWDLSKRYPINKNGKKLILLAQINFEKENFESDKLPKTGILQFFVEDKFNCADTEVNKVIYHENIDRNITEDDIKRLNIPTTLDSEIDIIIKGEYKLLFKKVKETISVHDYRLDDVLEKVYNKLYDTNDFDEIQNEWTDEGIWDDIFPDGEGHKLLGFPHFCQEDPRRAIISNASQSVKLSTSVNDNGNKTMSWFPSASDMNKMNEANEKVKEFSKFNTLLLQIDSCDEFTWGDGGQINIFINSKDLKNLKFDKVLWNFDCY